MILKIKICALSVLCLVGILPAVAAVGQQPVELLQEENAVRVNVGGKLFTRYIYQGHRKPILYPIVGPNSVEMTRNYPIKKGVPNEANDHPHHESFWFTHGNVNGVDFWSSHPNNGRDSKAQIRQQTIRIEGNSLVTTNQWLAGNNKLICTDQRELTFAAADGYRTVDFGITLRAAAGDVKLGDTKEGTMAMRVHPRLRFSKDPQRGNHEIAGHAINSAGDKDKAVWGKRAAWVTYWGDVDGKSVGVAFMDHPDNPRHPTWWHARSYGLLAANPFGIHDFDRSAKQGAGDMLIKQGGEVSFRYRFVFYSGSPNTVDIAKLYRQFAEQAETAKPKN